MPTIVEDIYGSTHTLGYDSSQGERVVRRHYVEGITGNSPLETAITTVTHPTTGVNNFSTRFPALALAGMQRQSVTAKQIGVGKFIVEELYAWNSSSWGNFPTTSLAEFRTGYESTQCYTVGGVGVSGHGIPGTIAQGATWKDLDGATKQSPGPQPYSFMRPVIRIGVPFKLGTNPLTSGIYGLVGKLNLNTVTIVGTSFTAGQLRFDGIEMSARTNSGTPFQGTYMYTASRSFAEQRVEWDTSTQTWKVVIVTGAQAYDSANF